MEEQNPIQQNTSNDTQENQPKPASPQKPTPSKITSTDPPKSPLRTQNTDVPQGQSTDDQAKTNSKESTGKMEVENAAPEVTNTEIISQTAQKESEKTDVPSIENTQTQSNTQIIPENKASAVEVVKKPYTGPRISFYGSCECDQFYVDGARFIIKRPFDITNLFSDIERTVYSVVCGGLHTLILLTNGEVYSLGCNDDGALGRDGEKKEDKEEEEKGESKKDNEVPIESRPGKVNLPVPIDMIAAGDSHSIACNSANSIVFQWGVYRNVNKGNLSKVSTPHRIGEKELGKKKIKKILSGANHTLVLAEEKVYVWGDSEAGILGRIPTERRMVQQGLNIEGLAVRHVENIFTGAYHSFLTQRKKRKTDGGEETYSVLLAWGLNNHGQLGIGTLDNMHVPTEIEQFEGVEIKDLRGGEHHTILLTGDGDVYGFGKNDEGQLGVGNIVERLQQERAEAKEARRKEREAQKEAEKEANKEKMVDESEEKKAKKEEVEEEEEEITKDRLKNPVKLNLKNIEKIFSGANFNYAIDKENKVYSWGMGDNYILGNKEEDTVEEPEQLDADFFKGKAIMFGLGAQHVVSLIADNATVTFELEEDVTKVIEKAKKTPASASKGKKTTEKIEEEKKEEQKKEIKKTTRGRQQKKNEDKIEEEKEEEEEGQEEEQEDEEEEKKKSSKATTRSTRGRSKTQEKKGKVAEKKTTKASASKGKATKEKKETKPVVAEKRGGRKRRATEKDEEEDAKELKKVKKNSASRSKSKPAKKAVQTKRK